MTKPVNRPHKKSGRKRKHSPPAITMPTPKLVETLAAAGFSYQGIARMCNTSKDVLHKWIEEDQTLAEAYARGKDIEHYKLFNRLFKLGMRGNVQAICFILRCRHGWKESGEGDGGNKLSVTFALPGALPLEDFKVIEHEPINRDEPVPAEGNAGAAGNRPVLGRR